MELHTQSVKKREGSGKGPSYRTRAGGDVPGIVYGGGGAPLSIAMELRAFELLLHSRGGAHAVVKLEVEGAPELNTPALLKLVQRHPVNESVLHADFQRIDLDKRMHTSVPVVCTGHSKGIVAGGILEQQLREVDIECLALEVPLEIVVDITDLDVGDSVHVADLKVPAGVTVLTEADRAVAAIHLPRVAKAEAEGGEGEAAAGAADVPEIAKKKEKEEK